MVDTAALDALLEVTGTSLSGNSLTTYNNIVSALDAGTLALSDLQTHTNAVVSQYFNGLDRAPDTAGKLYWINTLVNGGNAQILSDSFDSSTEGKIVDLYHSFLGRARDDGGLTFWANTLDSGVPLETISASFSGSAEFADVIAPKFGSAGVGNFIYGVLPNTTYTGTVGAQDLFLIDAANVDGAILSGFSLSEGDVLRTGDSVVSLAFSQAANSTDTIITITRTDGTTETVTLLGVAASDITSNSVEDYLLGVSSSDTAAITFADDTPPTPTADARTFTFQIEVSVSTGIEISSLMVDPIDSFFFNHDMIQIENVLTGQNQSFTGSVYIYDVAFSSFSTPPTDPVTAFQFAVFETLGFAHRGDPNSTDEFLRQGEVALFSYTDGNNIQNTYLFVDAGSVGVGGGMDNGAGSAAWDLDKDRIINLTGILNVNLTSGTTLAAEDLFI